MEPVLLRHHCCMCCYTQLTCSTMRLWIANLAMMWANNGTSSIETLLLYVLLHTAYLQHNAFVNSKLGDDVGEQQVAVVLGGGVHAVLGQQAGPGKGHQATQFVPLFPVHQSTRLHHTTSSHSLTTCFETDWSESIWAKAQICMSKAMETGLRSQFLCLFSIRRQWKQELEASSFVYSQSEGNGNRN